ncbi:hypothetical protein ACL02T_32905 [Pseudonocardia sp. RS010]|uniref:hypothetical protein n=1 Tax=Pseudonocardia sp. RS010 TaxID=3385979 RepID=UPI0039A241F0
MTLTFAATTRNAIADALVDLLDAGSGAGTIEIRSGTRPAGPDSAAAGTLLATITLADPAFGAASAGAAALSDPASVNAVATGTATWFRAKDSDGTARFDGKVTETGGGGDLTLQTTSITSGLAVDITGGTVTASAGTAD